MSTIKKIKQNDECYDREWPVQGAHYFRLEMSRRLWGVDLWAENRILVLELCMLFASCVNLRQIVNLFKYQFIPL